MDTLKIIVLLTSIALCLDYVTARRGRNRFRGPGRRPGGRKFMHRNFLGSCSSCDVIPCSFTDASGKVLEERVCPPTFGCNRGPIKVYIEGTDYYFQFCNISFTPQLSQSCKHEFQVYWWSYHFYKSAYETPCPQGERCEAGPIEVNIGRGRYKLYFCGNNIPTEPIYKDILTKAACNINGHITKGCGWWSLCGTPELTLPGNPGNVTLKFCAASDLVYLNVFGAPCRNINGIKWFPPPVIKYGVPGDSVTDIATTPPNNDTEVLLESGGEDLPGTGVEAPGDEVNLP